MTLIVAAGCRDYALLLADRRVTREGQLVDDERNKLVVPRTPGARIVVAYTGVAQLGAFRTDEWLPERLRGAIEFTPDGDIHIRVGDHVLTDDTQAMALEIREADLASTRRPRARPRSRSE